MQKKYLEAGEIVSTHGVQGEVKNPAVGGRPRIPAAI